MSSPPRTTPPSGSPFSVGDRVVLGGGHFLTGSFGTITNSPGKVFNGWTVRLDSGTHVGVAKHHLRRTTS